MSKLLIMAIIFFVTSCGTERDALEQQHRGHETDSQYAHCIYVTRDGVCVWDNTISQ